MKPFYKVEMRNRRRSLIRFMANFGIRGRSKHSLDHRLQYGVAWHDWVEASVLEGFRQFVDDVSKSLVFSYELIKLDVESVALLSQFFCRFS